MSRITSVLKFPLVLSGAILILLALASRSSPRKKDRLLEIERPSKAIAWGHENRMRLYTLAISKGFRTVIIKTIQI